MRAALSKLVLLLDLVTRVKFLFLHHLSEKKEREKDIVTKVKPRKRRDQGPVLRTALS